MYTLVCLPTYPGGIYTPWYASLPNLPGYTLLTAGLLHRRQHARTAARVCSDGSLGSRRGYPLGERQ